MVSKNQKVIGGLKVGSEDTRVQIIDALAPELKQGLISFCPLIKFENGVVKDYSVNGNDGTPTGAIVDGDGFDRAVRYITDDDVTFADNADHIATDPFAISFWIKETGAVSGISETAVVSRYNFPSNWDFRLNFGNPQFFLFGPDGLTDINTGIGTQLELNQWIHFFVYCTSTAITMYKNKISHATGSGVWVPGTSTASNLGFGSRALQTNLPDGKIKYFRYYNNTMISDHVELMSKIYDMEKPEFAIS